MWGRATVTRGRDSVVVQVRVRPGAELDLGGPGPAGGQGGGRGGERGRARQRVPVVFEGAQLLVQALQLSVLLGLERHHLLYVPVMQEVLYQASDARWVDKETLRRWVI